jgi:hypothetical protein
MAANLGADPLRGRPMARTRWALHADPVRPHRARAHRPVSPHPGRRGRPHAP